MTKEQEAQQAQTMVKVFQTKFGGPDKDAVEVGNCYAACLATLTGKPIEFFPVMPPNVDETEENRGAYDKAISDKLAEAGFVSVKLNLDADSRDLIREKKILTGFPYIMSGTSPRGYWLHAVIFQDGEILHDPHPSSDGIINWRFQELLVPIKPWIVDSQAQKIAEQATEIERLKNPTIEPEKCEFCNGKGFRDIELPADMGNHTTEDCHWCKGTGDDNADNICCADCGLWWNELVIARGQTGNIHACSDCGGEWIRQ